MARACAPFSPRHLHIQSVDGHCVQTRRRTHVQNTVCSSNGERHTQKPETPRNTLVIPTRLFPCQCLEDKVRVAARSKRDEDGDYYNEEADVKYATSDFERVEKLAKPEVRDKGNYHERDHDEAGVPSFRNVVLVVEDRQ